jgi:hypothetical protein
MLFNLLVNSTVVDPILVGPILVVVDCGIVVPPIVDETIVDPRNKSLNKDYISTKDVSDVPVAKGSNEQNKRPTTIVWPFVNVIDIVISLLSVFILL